MADSRKNKISISKTSVKTQQNLTIKYKHATDELRISQLPEGQWLELTAVINKAALRIKKKQLMVHCSITKDACDSKAEKSAPTTPRTPRSIADVTSFSPVASSTHEVKKTSVSPNPMDYMNRFHQLCESSSTSLDMFRM